MAEEITEVQQEVERPRLEGKYLTFILAGEG